MPTALLDPNVLIALLVDDHVHHERVARWIGGVESYALHPVVEGSLVRFLVREGESAATAQQLLAGVHADVRCEFWSDGPSYAELDLRRVHGHRQVTDAYLIGIALARDSTVASLDAGVAGTGRAPRRSSRLELT